jgi:hypothetical protein
MSLDAHVSGGRPSCCASLEMLGNLSSSKPLLNHIQSRNADYKYMVFGLHMHIPQEVISAGRVLCYKNVSLCWTRLFLAFFFAFGTRIHWTFRAIVNIFPSLPSIPSRLCFIT